MYIKTKYSVAMAFVVALCMVMPSAAVFSSDGGDAEAAGPVTYEYSSDPASWPPLSDIDLGSIAGFDPSAIIGSIEIEGKGNGKIIEPSEKIETVIEVGPDSENNVMEGKYVFYSDGQVRVADGYVLILSAVDISVTAQGSAVFVFEKGASVAVSLGNILGMDMGFNIYTFKEKTEISLDGTYSSNGSEGSIGMAFSEGTVIKVGDTSVKAVKDNSVGFNYSISSSTPSLTVSGAVSFTIGGIEITYPTGEDTSYTVSVSGDGSVSVSYGDPTTVLKANMNMNISEEDFFDISVGMSANVTLANSEDEGISFKSGNVSVSVKADMKLDLGGLEKAYPKADVEIKGFELGLDVSVSETGAAKVSARLSLANVSADITQDVIIKSAEESRSNSIRVEVSDVRASLDAEAALADIMALVSSGGYDVDVPPIPSWKSTDFEDIFDDVHDLSECDWAFEDDKDVSDFYAAMDRFINDPISGLVDFYELDNVSYSIYGNMDDLAKSVAGMRDIDFSVSLSIGNIDVEVEGSSMLDLEVGGIGFDVSLDNTSSETDAGVKTVAMLSAEARVGGINAALSNPSIALEKIEADAKVSFGGNVESIYADDTVTVNKFDFSGSADVSLYMKGYIEGGRMMLSVDGGNATFDFSDEGRYTSVSLGDVKAGVRGADLSIKSLFMDTDYSFSVKEMSMKGPFFISVGDPAAYKDCDISVKNLSGVAGKEYSVDSIHAWIDSANGGVLELTSNGNDRTVSVNGGDVDSDILCPIDLFDNILVTQVEIIPDGASITFEGDSLLIVDSFYVQDGGKVSGSFATWDFFGDVANNYCLSAYGMLNADLGVKYVDGVPTFFMHPWEGYVGDDVSDFSGFTYDKETKIMSIEPGDSLNLLEATVNDPATFSIYVDGEKKTECQYDGVATLSIEAPEGKVPLFMVNQFGKAVGVLSDTGKGVYEWKCSTYEYSYDLYLTPYYGTLGEVKTGEVIDIGDDGARFVIPEDSDGTVTVKTSSGVLWEIDGKNNQGKTYDVVATKTVYDGHDAYILDCSGDAVVYLPVTGSDTFLYHVNDFGFATVIQSEIVEIDGVKYFKFSTDDYSYFYAGSDPYTDPSNSDDNGTNWLLIGGAVAAVAIIALAGAYFLHSRKAAA